MARSWVERAERGPGGAERATGRIGVPWAHVSVRALVWPGRRVARRYAASPGALRRRTVLFQYGGPRLGERAGTSVGSPSAERKRAMFLGSVTMATSFIRPLQVGHSRTSIPRT